MLPNKFHANQASSYCELISSGRYQSLVASAMKCNSNVHSHSSERTHRPATRW